MKTIFLFFLNLFVHPFQIATYGEEYSPKFFGFQNKESSLLLDNVLDQWSTPRYPDIGSYFYTTRADEIVWSNNAWIILKKVLSFNIYRLLSPVLFIHDKSSGRDRFSGLSFFQGYSEDRITIDKTHRRLFLMPLDDEVWTINGQVVNDSNWYNLGDHKVWIINVLGTKAIRTVNITRP